jgi:alpha/beta hydrolase fold
MTGPALMPLPSPDEPDEPDELHEPDKAGQRDEREKPAAYLRSLLASAPADVQARLAETGEFVLNEDNLAAMRTRQLRDPGTPSAAVGHADRLVPGRDGDPNIPVRIHRERGITQPRPALISIHGGGYVIGSHLGDDGRFDKWSPALRCVGISVGYRLAPRRRSPGPWRTATPSCAGPTRTQAASASTPAGSGSSAEARVAVWPPG